MRHYKTILLRKLAVTGWELVARDNDTDWWLEEFWEIRSMRQNWGYKLYILFLVDPLCEGLTKSQSVWAISAVCEVSCQRPLDESGVLVMDLVKGNFDQKLEAFIADINKYRDEMRL